VRYRCTVASICLLLKEKNHSKKNHEKDEMHEKNEWVGPLDFGHRTSAEVLATLSFVYLVYFVVLFFSVLIVSIYAPRGFAKFNTSNLAKPTPFCRLPISASYCSNRIYGNHLAANPPRFCHEKSDFGPLAKPQNVAKLYDDALHLIIACYV